MVSTRNSTLIKSELIRYITSLGIDVKTVTKARGNKGFFKVGRIDISKNLDDDSSINVLLHEFTHFIHYNIDNSLKDLEQLFGSDTPTLRKELFAVTGFVDNNALCIKLHKERDELKEKIKELTEQIKSDYPNFSLTEKFKEFRKYARWRDVKYLEKYDRVKVCDLTGSKIYTIDNLEYEFPDMPKEFVAYLTLKSKQRRRAKVSRRINKITNYYNEPCELFARLIEGLYIDMDKVKELAPTTFEKFTTMYYKNKYKYMRELFSIVRIIL